MSVAFYVSKFQSLNPNRSGGNTSPHKMCMLFAIMDLIELGHIQENKVYYNQRLKDQFTVHFNQLKSDKDRNNPYLPFYHLQSSNFWHLNIKPEFNDIFNQSKSVGESKIATQVEYGYLDNELFDFLKSTIIRPQLRNALLENLDNLEVQYVNWARALGKSEKTAKSYSQAIKGSISNWATIAGVFDQNLISVASANKFQQLSEKVQTIPEFQIRNKKGNNMYSAALKSYQAFLDDINEVEIQTDIEQIITDKTIPETQKAAMVNTRIGQGKFRDDLIQYWQGCALTCYKKYQFLIASHIKPWSESTNKERLDPFNGFLLLANIDKAFDLGYISFTDKGNILISDQLDDLDTLGIYDHMQIDLHNKHQDYLAHHRELKFRV